MDSVNIAALKEYIAYDPHTGQMHWKKRPAVHTPVRVGDPAFSANHSKGYKRGNFLGRLLFAHRVVWAMHHGDWPEQIDHINGDRADNRIENLRRADPVTNGRNKRLLDSNTSGAVGVNWSGVCQKWAASICVNKRQVHLGTFENKDDAIAARKAAEITHGFHPNHGRAAS